MTGRKLSTGDYAREVENPFEVGKVVEIVSSTGEAVVYYGPSVYREAGLDPDENPNYEISEGLIVYNPEDLIKVLAPKPGEKVFQDLNS